MTDANLIDDIRPAAADWPEALRRAAVVMHIADPATSFGQIEQATDIRESGVALAAVLQPLGWRVRVIGDVVDGMVVPGAVLLARIEDSWCVLSVPADGGTPKVLDTDGESAATPLSTVLALTTGDALMIMPLRPDSDAATPAYMPTLRTWWRRYAELFIAGFGINVLALVLPVFSMLIYDKVIGNGITETLWALAVGVLLAAGLDFLLRVGRAWYIEQQVYGSDRTLDRNILDRLQASRDATSPPVGLVLNKYKELVAAREFVTSTYVLNAADLPFLLFFLLALWLIGGPVVLVFMACATALVLVHAVLSVPAHDYGDLSKQSVSKKVALLVEILSASELLKTSRLRVPTGRRWRALTDAAALASARGRFWLSVSTASTNFWLMLCSMGTLVAGVYMIEQQEMTTGGLVACTQLAGRGMSMVASVALLLSRFQQFRRTTRELDELISEPPTSDNVSSVPPHKIEGRLVTHELSYRFSEEGQFVLRDASISIAPGEKIALLGRPGSGKTTLLRCLAGVVPPSSGAVLLDGINIRAHHPVSRSRWLSYKPQEPLIFEGTLEDNVRAGADDVPAAAVLEALELAGLGEAIRCGELSLDMMLQTRGTNLSGGQRQGVALARSLLGSPSLLLLDEPTAGLDQLGEKAVAEQLKSFSRDRTLIVATHSPALVSIVDRLIVVDRGRIVADGPRERILNSQMTA